jgi:hypothetical protein
MDAARQLVSMNRPAAPNYRSVQNYILGHNPLDSPEQSFIKKKEDLVTIMILVLLVIPVFILYHLVNSIGTRRTDSLCLGTLLVFTLAFSAVLSLFTHAKRHEILGAAAAHCAVLVVFLGNVPDHKH